VRFRRFMRAIVLLLSAMVAAGCRDGTAAIEGGLRDPDAATIVWVDGADQRAAIAGASFRLEAVRKDTLELRFASDSDDVGTMRLLGLGSGARLTLHGIWFDDGVAFPSSIELSGTRLVNINGIRMASPERVTGRVEIAGELLANGGGEALILRPLDDGLPDLRVVVPREATVRGEDGEPISLNRLQFGDSLTVRGMAEDGYLHASEVIVPRRIVSGTRTPAASPEAAAVEVVAPQPSPSPPVRSTTSSPTPAAQPARGREAAQERPPRGRDRPDPPGQRRGQSRGNNR
jgi:hypothetical protein